MNRLCTLMILPLACAAAVVGHAANFDCGGITYHVTDSVAGMVEVAATEAHKQLAEVVIPAVVSDGDVEWRVTGIGDGAFYMGALSQVTLPEGLTRIGEEAFRYTYLSHVDLPSTLTTIEYGAFGETGLCDTLVIPDAVTKIGSAAFTYIPITTLRLGRSVERLEGAAFAECYNLTDIGQLPASLTTIGGEAFAMCGVTSADIPSSVRVLGAGAFYASNLHEVTLHEGLELIGEDAFAYTPLTAVNIPASVSGIGIRAFAGTAHLPAVTVDAGNSHYTAVDGMLCTAQADTLVSCPGGKTGVVRMPATMRVLKLMAMAECQGVTAVVLNDGLTEVGVAAFDNCSALDSLCVPPSIEKWGADLSQTAWYARQPDGVVYLGPVAMSKHFSEATLRLRPGTRCVVDHAFYHNDAIQQVVLPRGLVSIGNAAFAYTKLKTLRLPATVKHIGTSAFSNCGGLKRINFPQGLETMGAYTLATCLTLNTIISYCPEPPEPRDWYSHSFGYGSKCVLYCPIGSKAAYDQGAYSTTFVINEIGPLGDLNNDGTTDIDDLNRLTNMLLNLESKPLPTSVAHFVHDLNGDDNIDIDDINELLNIMLNK